MLCSAMCGLQHARKLSHAHREGCDTLFSCASVCLSGVREEWVDEGDRMATVVLVDTCTIRER